MLIRMIANVGRWDGSKPVHREDATIWGDAVTDLKTTSNKLSTWLGDTKEDLEDAIVALALSRSDVQKMSYMVLDEAVLKKLGIDLVKSMGESPGLIKSIRETKHRDLLELDIKRLEMLSQYMIDLAKTPAFADWNKTKEEVRELLEKYKNEKKINPNKVNKSLKENLGW